MSLPLHTKYRPKSLDEFLGNDSVVESLRSLLQRKEGMPHAFLFTGPAGCGKTTLGRIVAKELGCEEGTGLYEYDAATTRGIDTIRQIREASRYTSFFGGNKIYLLDEVHQVTSDGQEALLKILEHPPEHIYFILCTTEPGELKDTLRQRCTSYQVNPLQRAKLTKLLTTVIGAEGVEVSPEIIKDIAHNSGGSPRNALVMLDQIMDMSEGVDVKDILKDGGSVDVQVNEICRLLLETRKGRWKDVALLLTKYNKDVEKLRRGIAGYLMAVLLSKEDDRVGEILECFLTSYMYIGKAGLVHSCYLACKI